MLAPLRLYVCVHVTIVTYPGKNMAQLRGFYISAKALGQTRCTRLNAVSPIGSLGPRPKTNPSADHFQYRVLYWKRYTRRIRSGDETTR